jgi:hypothetical protein
MGCFVPAGRSGAGRGPMSYSFKDTQLAAIFERKQTHRPGEPLEQAWQRTTWRRVFSRQNLDLAVVAILYVTAILLAIGVVLISGLFTSPNGLAPALQIIFGTAVFGTFVELLRRTYDAAIKRLSTIDLFTSEVLSIVRVFASGNIIGHFVRLYDKIDAGQTEAFRDHSSSAPAQLSSSPSGFADTARKENYFSIFDKNSSDLGGLDPAAVNDITAFYTFLKASRDATGSMDRWKDPNHDTSMKKEDLITIIYLCFLMTIHGSLALDRLVSSEANRSIVGNIVSGVQLQCFVFLDCAVPRNDFRFARIEERRENCAMLRAKYGYDFGPTLAGTPP